MTDKEKDLFWVLNSARDWIEDTKDEGCEQNLKSVVRTMLKKHGMWDLGINASEQIKYGKDAHMDTFGVIRKGPEVVYTPSYERW